MAVKIITGEDGEQVLYCSTTMMAFGMVHTNPDHDLNDFIEWLEKDPRKYTIDELLSLYYEWLKAEQLVESLNTEQ